MIENILKYDDTWETVKKLGKPVFLYGMGDGADKVLTACERKGIEVSGVFASDGFAKRKLFHGFTVVPYSEVCEQNEDFTVLLSFASSLPDVIENINRIASERTLLCPDVPVFGGGLFDKEFVTANYEYFKSVYTLLSDEKSKENYTNIILGKMTGNINFLIKAETDVAEAFTNIIKPVEDSHYLDIGAYNGDTIREYLSFAKNCRKITAFEPDIKNFKKLTDYALSSGIDTSSFYNIAAWNKTETLTFYSRSGRNSAGSTSHKGLKSIEVKADAVDNYINEKVDYINIDAEGSDKNVIYGLENTLKNYKPCISCAVYHRNEDMFEIPLLLHKIYGKCEMYIRHFPYFPAWDTNVYVMKV